MEHRVYKALILNHHILGTDRELFLMLTLICVSLALITVSMLVTFCSLGFFILCFSILRLMGSYDLKLRQVYLRFIKYKTFYKAQAHGLEDNLIEY